MGLCGAVPVLAPGDYSSKILRLMLMMYARSPQLEHGDADYGITKNSDPPGLIYGSPARQDKQVDTADKSVW